MMLPLFAIYPLTAHLPAESNNWLTTLLQSNALNVLLALGVLGYLAARFKIGSALDGRQQQLAASVQQMEQQKLKAQQCLQQVKHRSELLHREIDQILSEARQSADALAKQIVQQAEQDAERIRQQAQAGQQSLLAQAQDSIQQVFLGEVLTEAEAALRTRMQHVDPHNAINQFIERLPQTAPPTLR
jgi:F-type H+-transporting ATPase subunit b